MSLGRPLSQLHPDSVTFDLGCTGLAPVRQHDRGKGSWASVPRCAQACTLKCGLRMRVSPGLDRQLWQDEPVRTVCFCPQLGPSHLPFSILPWLPLSPSAAQGTPCWSTPRCTG
jgi:hypothetical protein